MDGIINIDKPKGCTSFDVIRKLKKLLNMKKIGHTGTLDPLATGVLVICLGRATKLASEIEALEKSYITEFILGAKTDTYDSQGEIIEKSSVRVDQTKVETALFCFLGDIKQVPPMYSAIKIDGKKLYELARKGVVVERKSRDINISKLKLLDFNEELQSGKFYSKVSKGTYVRSLIFDLGEKLNTYAYMSELQRTEVGEYSIKKSYTIKQLETMVENSDFSFIDSIEETFDFEKIKLTKEKNINLFLNGNTVESSIKNGKYKIYVGSKFTGLGTVINNRLKGWKVF